MIAIQRYFRVISFDEIEQVKARRISFPLIITFDDGLMDNHRIVLPILKQLGLKATFILNTLPLEGRQILWTHNLQILCKAYGMRRLKTAILKTGDAEIIDSVVSLCAYVSGRYSYDEVSDLLRHLNSMSGITLKGRELYMGKSEVKDLLNSGMGIGCHGRTHWNLTNLQDTNEEVLAAKQFLEGLCNREIETFAYPFGDPASFDSLLNAYLKRHFRNICTTVPKINRNLEGRILHRICSYQMRTEKIILKLLLGI